MKADAKWIVDAWAEELKSVLQFLTAEDWSATIAPASSSVAGGHHWWAQEFKGAEEAHVWIGAPALAWSELGARILQAAGVDLIEQASAKSTYLEAVQQAMSGLARILTNRIARPIDAADGSEAVVPGPGVCFELVLNTGGLDVPAIRVIVSHQLCSAFYDPSRSSEADSETRAAVSAAQSTFAPEASGSPNVSVLLDVQMPVSICFGRASMPLREVMKLTSGSAVELDRRPDDDVDIIVNDCVIARGEVVVIDGNYGVRVTAIVSREQRMALRAGAR